MTTATEPNELEIWQNPAYGARNRVAHYLATVVKEGNTFTIDTLRNLIRRADGAGIDEVDRRARDLKDLGWIIRNYKDRAGLRPNELYLEKIGDLTWEPGYKVPRPSTLSANDRRAVYERDGRRCLVCGIDFGDEYPHLAAAGKHVQARPTIGHWIPKERGGTDDLSNLRPECHLCNEQSRNLTGTPVDVELVKRQIGQLKREDKRKLSSWLLMGRRGFNDLDNAWAEINQLPETDKEEIKKLLGEMLGE